MVESKEPLVDAKKWIICVALSGLFWAYMTWVLIPFIPGKPTETMRLFWSGFTAIPIAGTFYLASICFTATLVDQLRRKKA